MHSNDHTTAQSLMVSVTVSSLGATQLHFLEPGVKVNGDYYRNTVLLICFWWISALFSGITTFFRKMGHQHIVHVTPSPCCRERRQSLSPQRCGHLIRQIWIRWTTASGVCFKRGSIRSWIYDVSWKNVESWKNVDLLREWRLLDHTVIAAAIAQWHIRLNACVRVNGGHFEHKFWASDFLLCFVCFIDNGSPKCDVIDINMCKVLILCEMCYFCVWDFHTVW